MRFPVLLQAGGAVFNRFGGGSSKAADRACRRECLLNEESTRGIWNGELSCDSAGRLHRSFASLRMTRQISLSGLFLEAIYDFRREHCAADDAAMRTKRPTAFAECVERRWWRTIAPVRKRL